MPMNPQDSAPPPPRGPLTRLREDTIVNFLGMHTRLHVAKCAFLKCKGPQPGPTIPSGWSLLAFSAFLLGQNALAPFAITAGPPGVGWGPRVIAKGAPLETMGPLAPLYSGRPWPNAHVSKSPTYVYVRKITSPHVWTVSSQSWAIGTRRC